MIPFFLKMSSTVPSGDPIKGAVAVIPLLAETTPAVGAVGPKGKASVTLPESEKVQRY